MTASAPMVVAFDAWKLAELAMHYAAPCPDAVMDHLNEHAGAAFSALQAMPPENADDMLLKLYAVMLREFEPRRGEPPMRLSTSRSYEYDEAFYERLNADFASVSGEIASAAAAAVSPYAQGESA